MGEDDLQDFSHNNVRSYLGLKQLDLVLGRCPGWEAISWEDGAGRGAGLGRG